VLNLQINDRRARAGAAVAVQPRAASCECWRRGWMPPVVLKTDDLNRWTNELTHTYTRTRVRRECCCTYHTHIGKYIARRSVKWKKKLIIMKLPVLMRDQCRRSERTDRRRMKWIKKKLTKCRRRLLLCGSPTQNPNHSKYWGTQIKIWTERLTNLTKNLAYFALLKIIVDMGIFSMLEDVNRLLIHSWYVIVIASFVYSHFLKSWYFYYVFFC